MQTKSFVLVLAFGLLGTLAPDRLQAEGFTGIGASVVEFRDRPVRAKHFGDFSLSWFQGPTIGAEGETGLRCTVNARRGGAGVKGVRFEFAAHILEGSFQTRFEPVAGPVSVSAKTNSGGYAFVGLALPSTSETTLPFIDVAPGSSKKIDQLRVSCFSFDRVPCLEGLETACLLRDQRLRVEVDWRTDTDSGHGFVIDPRKKRTDFYFLDPELVDLRVRVENRCKTDDFFEMTIEDSAPAEVRYYVRVLDTFTGEENVIDRQSIEQNINIYFAGCP